MAFAHLPTDIADKLNQIDSVATLPHIAAEILVAMRNKDVSIRKLSKVIEKDPSITVKILKIANSPLWGSMGRIESVQRALVLLGIRQVSNIVIAVSLYSSFAQLKPNPFFDRSTFWFHSIDTAQIARKLSIRLKINFNGEEFVAGLVHDLGKIIMDQFFSEPFRRIIENGRLSHHDNVAAEQEQLGCTHADIGAAILERWNFPPAIVTALRYHHHPEAAPRHREITAIVHLANEWSKYRESDDMEQPLRALDDDPAWRILSEGNPRAGAFSVFEFLQQFEVESEQHSTIAQLIHA